MSNLKYYLKLGHKWLKENHQEILAVANIVLVILTLCSLNVARESSNITRTQFQKAEVPWIRVKDENVEVIDLVQSQYRINSNIEHISGGPALNLAYKISINNNNSGKFETLAAILPKEKVSLIGPIFEQSLKSGDILTFFIDFEDVNGKKFNLTHKKQITEHGTKDLEYILKQLQ